MEAKYTPGPWKVEIWEYNPGRGKVPVIVAGDNATAEILPLWERPDGEQEENARRIVACVNACEGIPTEALECQSKRKISEAWVRQRDKLVSACQRAEAFIAGFEDDETQEGIAGLLAELRSAASLKSTA